MNFYLRRSYDCPFFLNEKAPGRKERYKHLKAEFQRVARRDKKAFFSDQCKEIEEQNGKD